MDTKDYAEAKLAEMLRLAKRQFGNAIKGFWFYELEPCPGCGFPIDVIHYEGKTGLSLNTFIYRPRGILIGYFLCSLCAQQIFEAARRNPGVQTPLHGVIERNLITAYQRYLASQDA